MPMIPAGVVTGPRVAEKVEKFAWPAVEAPPPRMSDDGICLTPEGFIDNKAETNKWAAEVALALGEEMDVTDPVFCAGIVIMAGVPLNYRFGKVSNFTGLPRRFCQKVIQNLGYNRLVFGRRLGGELMAELEKPCDDSVAAMTHMLFVLYCLAGAGQVQSDKEGRWRATPPEDKMFYEIEKVA